MSQNSSLAKIAVRVLTQVKVPTLIITTVNHWKKWNYMSIRVLDIGFTFPFFFIIFYIKYLCFDEYKFSHMNEYERNIKHMEIFMTIDHKLYIKQIVNEVSWTCTEFNSKLQHVGMKVMMRLCKLMLLMFHIKHGKIHKICIKCKMLLAQCYHPLTHPHYTFNKRGKKDPVSETVSHLYVRMGHPNRSL